MASVILMSLICMKLRNTNITAKALFGYVIVFGLVAVSFFNLGKQWHHINHYHGGMKGGFIQHIIYRDAKNVSTNDRDYSKDKDGDDGAYHRRTQTVSECGCKRRFFYTPPGKHAKRLTSTCSDEGSFYETGQKVVSFSLHINKGGPDPESSPRIMEVEYMERLSENLKRMKAHYRGSSLRLYTDLTLERGSERCQLVCENPELHWCDIRKIPSLGDQSSMIFTTWRFLPLGDPTVDYFLSRDLDAFIGEREAVAVSEWLQSNKGFHLMRDKVPEHSTTIMGGLWGGRNSILGMEVMANLRKEIMEQAKVHKDWRKDKQILEGYVFHRWAKEMVAFDSYFCTEPWTRYTELRPFPTERKDSHSDFVGNNGKDKHNISKCPMECRPEQGRGWEYC